MRWEDYRNGEMMISQSVWNGISIDPKTAASSCRQQSLVGYSPDGKLIANVSEIPNLVRYSPMAQENQWT